LDLNLRFLLNYLTTRASPLGSPYSSESSVGQRAPNQPWYTGAWHACARIYSSTWQSRATSPSSPTLAGGIFWRIRRFLDGDTPSPPLTGPLLLGFIIVFCFFRLDLAVCLLHIQGLLVFMAFLS